MFSVSFHPDEIFRRIFFSFSARIGVCVCVFSIIIISNVVAFEPHDAIANALGNNFGQRVQETKTTVNAKNNGRIFPFNTVH